MTPVIQGLSQGIRTQNGELIAQNLNAHHQLSSATFRAELSETNIEAIISQVPAEPPFWRDVVRAHLRHITDPKTAYAERTSALTIFLRYFGATPDTRWLLPVLYRLIIDLWTVAKIEPAERQQEAARLLNRCFTICINDRLSNNQSTSRKWGSYWIANLLFKVYFHLRQINLCGNLVRAMEAAELPERQLFPKSERCTFAYYAGRFHLINNRAEQAETYLADAYALMRHCPFPCQRNQQLILHHLIPARLILRISKPRFPSPYDLPIRYLREGNLKAFEQWTTDNMAALLKLGTFMIWEQMLTMICFPQLIRHLYRLNHALVSNPTRLHLSLVYAAASEIFGEKETLCFLINVLSAKSVRGYISDDHQMLVLANTNAFPLLPRSPQ